MGVGAGFPRPIARVTNQGGENPPLRWIAWLRLIFNSHQPMVGVKCFYRRVSDDWTSYRRQVAWNFNRRWRDAGIFANHPVGWNPRLNSWRRDAAEEYVMSTWKADIYIFPTRW